MIEMVDQTSRVMIYSPGGALLGKAALESILADDRITFIVKDEVFDNMHTSFILTLSNDAYGLISYRAEIITFMKESVEHGTRRVVVRLVEFIERVQRRENFKIKVPISIVIRCGGDECQAEIKDISASGVLVAVDMELCVGQTFDFTFNQLPTSFDLTAEVLRCNVNEAGVRECGCRFINMTVEKESSIRRFIFRLQLAKAAGSPAFHQVGSQSIHHQD